MEPIDEADPARPTGVCQGELGGAPPELLGVLDVVEAFTTLRQELRLQVRAGRDLQQSLQESLQRIEMGFASPASSSGDGSEEIRKLVEALSEIDEGLHRAVEVFSNAAVPPHVNFVEAFDHLVRRSSWLTRTFARRVIDAGRAILSQCDNERAGVVARQGTARQGLEILRDRVAKLMRQHGLERVEVLHSPFDGELMRAIDVMEAPHVASSHVAEQLRPAYRWRGKLLRCADVRLAK